MVLMINIESVSNVVFVKVRDVVIFRDDSNFFMIFFRFFRGKFVFFV